MLFFRYLFLITIFACCTSVGILVSKSYSDRLKELKNLSSLINIVKNKITFTHRPLVQIFEEVAQIDGSSKISNIFSSTSEKLQYEPFKKAWDKAIGEQKKYLNLKNEDINLIKTFGNMIGKTDISGQVNEIDEFILLLNSQIVIAEEEKNKNFKMHKSLGVIIGLGIVIILF